MLLYGWSASLMITQRKHIVSLNNIKISLGLNTDGNTWDDVNTQVNNVTYYIFRPKHTPWFHLLLLYNWHWNDLGLVY